MSAPTHTLAIFMRPKEGSNFIKRVVAFNYRHSISAMGGYDTASCAVAVRSQGEGQEYLDRYLGCRVYAYADNPYEPIWEGFINRITFNSGGVSYSISLDEMANRINIKYSNDSASVNGIGTLNTSPTVNSVGSQNIYGIKQASIEFGYNRNGNTGHPHALRDTILAQRAFPQTSITKGGGGEMLVSLEMLGFFHTLEWETVNYVSAATTQFDAHITTNLLPALGNGTTFFDNTDFGDVTTNTTATTGTTRNGQSYWEVIQKIAEGGDASNYWIAGIGATNPQTGTRRLYYKQVNGSTLYTARARDGLRIRNLYGALIPPWTVKPDNTVLVSDVLVGYKASIQVDPRLTYIFRIEYDAEQQSINYFGADDTTASGSWMIRRGFKPYNRAFNGSAMLRVIS